MLKLARFFFLLVQSYLFVIIIALVAGLFFSRYTLFLTPYSTLFLQIIFFLSSVKLDPKLILKEMKDVKMICYVNVLKLLIFPAVVFFIAKLTIPELAVPLLLLTAMPTGMTTPLLTEVAGGKVGIALVLTLTTSLLAPFSIPLVISFFAKTAVTVSALTMFWNLTNVIFIPFLLAQIVRHFFQENIKTTYKIFKPVSLILLGLLISGAVAKQAIIIHERFGLQLANDLLILFILIALFLVAGYFVSNKHPDADKIAISLSLTFMNFSLSIFLASLFFKDPNVLLTSVLVIIPWALMLIPFKYFMKKIGVSK